MDLKPEERKFLVSILPESYCNANFDTIVQKTVFPFSQSLIATPLADGYPDAVDPFPFSQSLIATGGDGE